MRAPPTPCYLWLPVAKSRPSSRRIASPGACMDSFGFTTRYSCPLWKDAWFSEKKPARPAFTAAIARGRSVPTRGVTFWEKAYPHRLGKRLSIQIGRRTGHGEPNAGERSAVYQPPFRLERQRRT